MRNDTQPLLSRRQAVAGGAATVALLLGARASAATSPPGEMTIYRDPGCGCCLAWAAHARRAGFRTRVIDAPDMASVKRRLGVPAALASCHTAVVGGIVVEGHVPLDRVERVLRRRPAGVRGLAVPGMPIGAPGMESPDGRRQAFQIFTFNAAGRATPMR